MVLWLTGCQKSDINSSALEIPSQTLPSSITAIIFDSGDSYSPSPRDSRWKITDRARIAAVYEYIQSAMPVRTESPIPQCAPAGCLQIVSHSNHTNMIYIVHIHRGVRSVAIRKSSGQYGILNGEGFLSELAVSGVHTNQFYVD